MLTSLNLFPLLLLLLIWWIPKTRSYATPHAVLPASLQSIPDSNIHLHARDVTSASNSSSSSPSLNLQTSILGTNGVDVSSSFRTLIYFAPPVPPPPRSAKGTTPPNNLNSPDGESGVRYLQTCTSRTAHYAGSHCLYKPDVLGSMQGYIIHCRDEEPPPQPVHTPSSTLNNLKPNNDKGSGRIRYHYRTAERGACAQDEVCMPGATEVWEGSRTYTAGCVKRNSFRTRDSVIGAAGNDQGGSGGNQTMAGVTVVLSRADGQAPLEAGTLRLDVRSEAVDLNTKLPLLKKKVSCTECVKVRVMTARTLVEGKGEGEGEDILGMGMGMGMDLRLGVWLDPEKMSGEVPRGGLVWVVVQLA